MSRNLEIKLMLNEFSVIIIHLYVSDCLDYSEYHELIFDEDVLLSSIELEGGSIK